MANLPPVSLTLAATLSPVSLSPVASLPLISMTPAVAKFGASAVGTGVVDTGGAPLTCDYLRKFSEKFEMTLML